MSNVINVILLIIKAIPALQRGWDTLIAAYLKKEIQSRAVKRREGVEALKKAQTDEELLEGLRMLVRGPRS